MAMGLAVVVGRIGRVLGPPGGAGDDPTMSAERRPRASGDALFVRARLPYFAAMRWSAHARARRSPDTPRDAFATRAVHAGAEPDEATGAVSPPIYQTSTFAQDGVGRPRRGYEYARSQNPTRERLERAVADLEGGRHGIAFASGSATTAAIAQLAGAGRRDPRGR